MRKLLFIFLSTIIILPACQEARKSPHETVSNDNIKITYGRPYKKGRNIFGGLQPYGKVWRTGADEATEITFSKDVSFSGKPVKAGTYSWYSIPDKENWTIILNSETGQSGMEYNQNRDLLRVQVPSKKLDHTVEQLTFRLEANSIVMEWDQTQVVIPVQFQ